MEDISKKDKKDIEEIISVGADVAGAAVSGAIGFFAGDAGGAALLGASGSVVTHLLGYLGKEIKNRFLGKREQVRIGALLAFATNKIQEKLKQGLKIRDDGFFTESPENRSSAEEIFEGVILAAQREHE